MGIKEIRCKLIPSSIAKKLIVKNHYSHRWPSGNRINYGVFYRNRLVGAVCYGAGASPWYTNWVKNTKKSEYLELTRLWIKDGVGKNSESRSVAYTLRDLHQKWPKFKWVISFADENEGHLGGIYQALNFVYTGKSSSSNEFKHNQTGKVYPSRTVGEMGLGIEKMNELGFEKIKQKGKHRYFYFLNKKWRKNLILEERPYPKRGEAGVV